MAADSSVKATYMSGDAVVVADSVTSDSGTSVVVREENAVTREEYWSRTLTALPGETTVAVVGDWDANPFVVTTADETGTPHTFVTRLDRNTGATAAHVDIAGLDASGAADGPYVVGTVHGTFGGHSTQGNDVAVVALSNTDLSTSWSRVFGTAGDDRAVAMAADSMSSTKAVLFTTASAAYVAEVTDQNTSSYQPLPAGDYSHGTIGVDQRFGIAVAGAGVVQMLTENGSLSKTVGLPAGLTLNAITVGELGFTAAGTTTADVDNLKHVGGTDAVIYGFDGANNPAWAHVLGTTADEQGTDVVWFGSRFALVGTTTGSLDNVANADVNGDVFIGVYPQPAPGPVVSLTASAASDNKSISGSWTRPNTGGLTITSYDVTLTGGTFPNLVEDSTTVTNPTATFSFQNALAPGDYIFSVAARSGSDHSSESTVTVTIPAP